MNASRNPDPRATHDVPSGLGGVFHVAIVGDGSAPGHVRVRIVHPSDRDWHGREFEPRAQDLRPLPKAVRS